MSSAEVLEAKINSLLPGATSAGLASSFRERATELDKEVVVWHGISFAALVVLVVYAFIVGPALVNQSTGNSAEWTAVLSRVILKALVASPLVWLALSAGHRGTLAKRVREDYRYKAALYTAFEGFKNQLSDIESDGEPPLVGLSRNVLSSLAAAPGRLYDVKHQEVTPLSAVVDTFSKATRGNRANIKTPSIEAEIDSASDNEDAQE